MRENDLLAAVLAAPDDDGPRLVYADWLMERGDARGEFIALQCAIARGQSSAGALARKRELFELHGASWMGSFGLKPGEAGFVRGFVETLFAPTPARLLQLVPSLASAPVREVRLAELWRAGDAAGALASLVELRLLRSFRVSTRWPAGAPHVFTLPPQLEALECWLIFLLGVHGWRQSRLSSLAITNLDSPYDLQQLLDRPLPATLTSLDLHLKDDLYGRDSSSCNEELRLLVRAPALSALASLGLSHRNLADTGLTLLAGCEALSRLERLDVSHNHIGNKGIRALARSPHLPRLAWLDLRDNRIEDSGAVALASSPHLQSLQGVEIRGNPVGAKGLAALRERFGEGLQC